MAKIEIYARMRPTERQYNGIKVTTDPENNCEHIMIKTGDEQDRLSTPINRYSRPHNTSHSFQFKRVFQETATQAEVFDTVSKNIIDSFLEGYNGTIFAYGQTSSGKTHTIEGGGRKFADRGIIPRSLSYIYKQLEGRIANGEDLSVHVSYMEIYQDTGYDLLNPGMRPGALMVTLPKINISEGPAGRVVVRNLSSHLASSEEVAQSLLFQGSTCRKVAETSMNQCSSRSHSIFIITLTATTPEVITKSKLNLVDLAGSERVAKTGADGKVLQEAKHINLSLHHLEHVIVTLQQQLKSSNSRPVISPSSSHSGLRKSRERSFIEQSPHTPRTRESRTSHSGSRPTTRGNHIPYRNCMLTMVLKDSLGGNCLTAMIATISIEEDNLGETVSTLRFSQRVACISNRARKNEELDDKAVIKKLKQRIAELESEVLSVRDKIDQEDSGVSLSTSSTSTQSLTDQEKITCHQILHSFFHGKIDNPVTAGINTAAKFHECLQVLKMVVLQALGITKQASSPHHSGEQVSIHAKELASQVKHSLQPSQTATPSHSSRLSSGFGSLVDTEESNQSHNRHIHLSSHQQPIHTSPPPMPSVRKQLVEQRMQKKIEHQQKHSKHHDHYSPPNVNSHPKSHLKSEHHKSSNHTQTHSSPKTSESLPRQTNRAWMSPVTSPRPGTKGTPSTAGSEPHSALGQAKTLSPREERLQLMARQEELKQSKYERKQLANQVQLLDLHVEEEKLKSQLEHIGKQLAEQHTMVAKLQRADSNWDQLCAEKIAEQQLRIKQAKVYQRLMDVQYYLQSIQHQDRVSFKATNDLPAPSVQHQGNVWTGPSSGKNSSRVQRELEKHELKRTQIEDDIEKLRMSQKEKELELKEATTRRKILALKQQLLAGRTNHQAHKDDVRAASQSNHHIKTLTSPKDDSRAKTVPEPTRQQLQTAAEPTRRQHQTAAEPSRQQHHVTTASGLSRCTHSQYDPESPLSNIEPAVLSSPMDSNQTSTTRQSDSVSKPMVDISRVESDRRALETPRKDSPLGNTKSSPPVRLTLPEEIKETEYMSAVQRQKARVSRIRRCIVAATLIQRAWRNYKQKT